MQSSIIKIILVSFLLLFLIGCGGGGNGGSDSASSDVEVPDGLAKFDKMTVSVDNETGAKVVRNEILLKFYDGVDDDTIKNTIDNINGSIIGGIKEIGLYFRKTEKI